MDVDHGQFVYPCLKDVALVRGLDELAPVGGRASSRCERRRLERFAQVRQDLPDRPRLRNERDQPDITATTGALEWKLLPHPGHELRLAPATTIWYRVYLVVNRRDRAIELARSLVDKVDYRLLTFDPAATPRMPVHVRDDRVVDPAAAEGPPAFELYAKPVPGSLPVFLLEDTATGWEVVSTDPYRFVPQEPLDLGVPADHPHHDYYANVKGIALDHHTTKWKRLLGYGLRVRPDHDDDRFQPVSSAAGPELFPAANAHHVDVWVRAAAK